MATFEGSEESLDRLAAVVAEMVDAIRTIKLVVVINLTWLVKSSLHLDLLPLWVSLPIGTVVFSGIFMFFYWREAKTFSSRVAKRHSGHEA